MLSNLRLNSGLTSFIKLFIFAVITQNLLYFYFFPGGQLGRILQLAFILITIFILLVSVFRDTKVSIDISFLEANPFIFFFMGLVPISFLVGYFSGNLSLDLNAYQLIDYTRSSFSSKVISRSFNEIFILIYYFFFFYFLTYLLVNKKDSVDYFFKVFRVIFIAHIFLGYLDWILYQLFYFDLFSRHLYEGVHIGSRWHGIAGEPRQASVYMAFGISVIYLESFYRGTKFSPWWLVITVPAIFLTVSFTSMISLAILFLLLLPVLVFVLYKNPLLSLIFFICISILIYIAFTNSRIAEYAELLSTVFIVIENGSALPFKIRMQMGEIFPLYDQFKAFSESDYMPLLFGSGLGTSAINNYSYVDHSDAFGNPNSQIIRSVYESGLVGTALFILIFYWPILSNKKLNFNKKLELYVFTTVVLAFSLGVRSPAIFIYLGILSSVLSNELYFKKL
jgi:hypothetical protein